MNFPLLYQINTRIWLHELSQHAAGSITLASIPGEQFRSWIELGFTHIWLMGVWKTGPHAHAHAVQHFCTHWRSDPDLGDFSEADVTGSPFAIARYEVADEFGAEPGLAIFRERLHEHGLKLLLDFVPNHLGLDHEWLEKQPALFVQHNEPLPGTFRRRGHPNAWFAHGRDPYFPAWTDTAQLDYRLAATRREMIKVLHTIAHRCDGVRCDMAMLLLDDVFAKTWHGFPIGCLTEPTEFKEEFWPSAIQAIKAGHPEFLFVAEAYWDLESRLQQSGFDFTYNKRVYDHLLNDEHDSLQSRLKGENISFLSRSVHFLENHDEARAAKVFTRQEHLPAALLTLCIPGLRLIHHGQLEGLRIHQRIQLRRRARERPDRNIASFYDHLLRSLRGSLVGKSSPKPLLQVERRSAVVGVLWTDDRYADMAIVNLAGEMAHVHFHWPFSAGGFVSTLFTNRSEAQIPISRSGSLLSIDLDSYAAHLLRFDLSMIEAEPEKSRRSNPRPSSALLED